MPIIAILLTAVSVAADQLLKLLVVNQLKPLGAVDVIPNFFSLVYVENRGAAFSILENKQIFLILFVSLLCLGILVLMFAYRRHTAWTWACSILVLSGGVGNLIDRIRLGYVVDYLKISFFPPVFNFADICVVGGVALFVVYLLLEERKETLRKREE